MFKLIASAGMNHMKNAGRFCLENFVGRPLEALHESVTKSYVKAIENSGNIYVKSTSQPNKELLSKYELHVKEGGKCILSDQGIRKARQKAGNAILLSIGGLVLTGVGGLVSSAISSKTKNDEQKAVNGENG